MARGMSAADGKWNFHVQRRICKKCKRKGVYSCGRGERCMYCDRDARKLKEIDKPKNLSGDNYWNETIE